MKVVILGAGRRGIRLAKHLTEEKRDVILIDNNSEVISNILSNVECLAFTGSGTNIDDLRNAEIQNADAFIALTSSDETNLVSCSIASSEFNIPVTICAIRNISYTKTHNLMGITHIINPYQETAKVIVRNIERGFFSDIVSFDNSSLVLYNVSVESGSRYSNKLVKDIRGMIPVQFVIAALMRNGVATVPNGDTIIREGDILSLAANENSVETILKNIGKRKQKAKKIVIVGGNKITDLLLMELHSSKHKDITLLDNKKDICEDFANRYPNLLVINESITKEGVFRREGLENYDLLIALTNTDEKNILISSYAKFEGVKSSIGVVEKDPDYLKMADYLKIDSIVSVQDSTVDSILKYLHGKNISTLHSLFNGSLEAFEYHVTEKSKLCNMELKDINMKGKGIITGVVKNNKTTIPNGMYRIAEGDTLIIVSERKEYEFMQKLLMEN